MSNQVKETRKKSKYQRKISRKRGRGRVDQAWVWWYVPRQGSES